MRQTGEEGGALSPDRGSLGRGTGVASPRMATQSQGTGNPGHRQGGWGRRTGDVQPLSLAPLGRAQTDLPPDVHLGLALGSSPPSLGFLTSEWGKATGPPAWRRVEGSVRPHRAPAARRSPEHQEAQGGGKQAGSPPGMGVGPWPARGGPGRLGLQPHSHPEGRLLQHTLSRE